MSWTRRQLNRNSSPVLLSSLVVKVSDSGWFVMTSSPVPLKPLRVGPQLPKHCNHRISGRSKSEARTKSRRDSAHDSDVIPLPFLVNQSECLHSTSLKKNLFFHSGLSALSSTNTYQIGEGGSAMIHIPKTLIEIEKNESQSCFKQRLVSIVLTSD
ncbi:hypothetical protein TNCV_4482961 [Trichonephila clavipes]|nr:hypothetical protein TNCV_4482961 [Trichonephila clavipes]